MKKIKYLLFLIALMFTAMLSVNAAELTSATFDKNIKIEGTGTGQIQIVLFNSNKEVMFMTTANAKDGKFSLTLPEIANLKNGEYSIKVADYDGKNADSKKVDVEIIAESNPKTLDNIYTYFLTGILSFTLITGMIISKKEKIKNNTYKKLIK